MSKETMESLNSNTIQGYGVKAWHYREGISKEPYPEAVPEQAVIDLFPQIIEVPAGYQIPEKIDANGVAPSEWIADPDSKALLRDDTGALLAIVGESYAPHQYDATLLGMGLPIASAGLLKEGRHAWVQYGSADAVTTPENVQFVTKLLTVTSADASLSTQFRYVTTLAVCDNTLAFALREGTETAQRVRHTRLSVPRVDTMRHAFGLLDDVAEETAAMIGEQIKVSVSDRQLTAFLDEMFPATAQGSEVTGRSLTIAENKREAVLARYGNMWGDYAGTEFGILQALDTATRWDFRTTDSEKVMTKVISGDFDRGMAQAVKTLDLILA